jgi:hypothetical protein
MARQGGHRGTKLQSYKGKERRTSNAEHSTSNVEPLGPVPDGAGLGGLFFSGSPLSRG